MKIDLNTIDRTQFYVDEHIWHGQVVYLVQPREMGCTWTQDNKIFRSSVWNSDNELISASFFKFVNWGEKPEVFPVPTSLKNATIMEKLDGSTLIVSKYKGHYMIRTRGTIDAMRMEKNGHEIEVFKNEVLPKLFKSHLVSGDSDTWNYSFVFEWTSPLNTIVLNYGNEPRFFLIGVVYHGDYTLSTQIELSNYAWELGLERPSTYTFKDVNDLLSAVDAWKNQEGVCVYHHGDQEIHKVKSADYLLKHRFKSNATLENTLDMYFGLGKPSYKMFETMLIQKFDFECFDMVRGYASSICDAAKDVQRIVEGITAFVAPYKDKPRKDGALAITASYGDTGRSNMAFTLLSNKPLNDEQLKKLFWQVLKK
jgi:RNA ligase